MPLLTQGQIVAFGGGGFAMEPDNPLLDDYVLGLCRRSRPRVCLIPTASGDSSAWIDRFYALFDDGRCEPTHLGLFSRGVDDLYAFLSEQDVLYVGGGNTVNLLAVWRAQGLDRVLPEVLAAGTILCGVSAGALCWFQRGITDSYSPDLKPLTNGLGLLPGAFSPHFDSDPRRPHLWPAFVARHGGPAVAAEDGVALHYVDGRIVRAVTSRPNARAYRYEVVDGEVRQEVITPEYLGLESARSGGIAPSPAG